MPDEKRFHPDFDPPINPEDEHPIESLPGADETQPLEAITEPLPEDAVLAEAAPVEAGLEGEPEGVAY